MSCCIKLTFKRIEDMPRIAKASPEEALKELKKQMKDVLKRLAKAEKQLDRVG